MSKEIAKEESFLKSPSTICESQCSKPPKSHFDLEDNESLILGKWLTTGRKFGDDKFACAMCKMSVPYAVPLLPKALKQAKAAENEGCPNLKKQEWVEPCKKVVGKIVEEIEGYIQSPKKICDEPCH